MDIKRVLIDNDDELKQMEQLINKEVMDVHQEEANKFIRYFVWYMQTIFLMLVIYNIFDKTPALRNPFAIELNIVNWII